MSVFCARFGMQKWYSSCISAGKFEKELDAVEAHTWCPGPTGSPFWHESTALTAHQILLQLLFLDQFPWQFKQFYMSPRSSKLEAYKMWKQVPVTEKGPMCPCELQLISTDSSCLCSSHFMSTFSSLLLVLANFRHPFKYRSSTFKPLNQPP